MDFQLKKFDLLLWVFWFGGELILRIPRIPQEPAPLLLVVGGGLPARARLARLSADIAGGCGWGRGVGRGSGGGWLGLIEADQDQEYIV